MLLDRKMSRRARLSAHRCRLDGYIDQNPGLDAGQLYEVTANTLVKKEVSYDFFVMAFDFLFLLGRVSIDEKGRGYMFIKSLRIRKDNN